MFSLIVFFLILILSFHFGLFCWRFFSPFSEIVFLMVFSEVIFLLIFFFQVFFLVVFLRVFWMFFRVWVFLSSTFKILCFIWGGFFGIYLKIGVFFGCLLFFS